MAALALLLRRFQSKRNSRFFVVPASSTAAAGLSVCHCLSLISFAVVVGVVRVATSFGRGREFTMTDVAGAELMPN